MEEGASFIVRAHQYSFFFFFAPAPAIARNARKFVEKVCVKEAAAEPSRDDRISFHFLTGGRPLVRTWTR